MNVQKPIMVVVIAILITLGLIALVRFLPVPGLMDMLTRTKSSQQDGSDLMTTSTQKQLVTELTSVSQVQRLTQSDDKMLFKFYSSWCGACMAAKTVYPALAQQFKDEVTFYAINVEDGAIVKAMETEGFLTEQVVAIPTFVFYEKGKVAATTRGFGGKEQLASEIKKQFSL